MDWLKTTLALYRHCLENGASLALRNWPVLGTLFVYVAVMTLAGVVAWPLGLAGGFLLAILRGLCAGSFLAMVEHIVRSGKVTWSDFTASFGAYLWDVVGVFFALWIVRMLLPFVAATPMGAVLVTFVWILLTVFLNPVPELIYLGHYSLGALFAESYAFIAENWVEWFPINFLLGAGLLALLAPIGDSTVVIGAQLAAASLFVYFAMIVRGLLFLELSQSSRRSRIFRYRAES